jgi:hypothetical protein
MEVAQSPVSNYQDRATTTEVDRRPSWQACWDVDQYLDGSPVMGMKRKTFNRRELFSF